MKTKLRFLAVALIAGGTLLAQPRVSIGVSVGGYGPRAYPPPAYVQYQPPYPGPGYTWVDGYWAPRGVWIAGYWSAPMVTVVPRYVEPFYRNAYRGHDRDRGWERREYRGNGFARGRR